MKTSKLLGALCASTLLFSVHSNTQAQTQFDQVIVFGASFLDSGTFLDPITGNTSGLRFTNLDPETGIRGSALSEILTSDLGLGTLQPASPLPIALAGTPAARTDGSDDPLDPSDNINFAVGAFQTDGILNSIIGESFAGSGLPGLNQRISLGLLTVSDNALFLVNAGGNDIRALADPALTATTTITILDELITSGAQTIILPTLPRLGEFAEAANANPDGSRTPLALARTAGAEAFNDLVDIGLLGIDANIIRADNESLFDEILADPTDFGFSDQVDQTSECFGSEIADSTSGGCTETPGLGLSSGGNPDDFIFEDGLHPTQRTAQISADYLESLLRAPSQIGVVNEAAYLSLVQHQSSLRSQLSASRFIDQELNTFRFFANINESDHDLESSTTQDASSDNTTGNIGFLYQVSSNLSVGLALGYVDQEVDIDNTGTSFENDGLLFSALANYQQGRWFAEAGLTFSELDIESSRGVTLGVAQRIERGDTEGDGVGLTFSGGYDLLSSKKYHVGPILRLDFNQFDVDNFSEEGTQSTSLSFSNIERDAFIASLGAFANIQSSWGSIPINYFGEITADADLEGDSDDIQVSLNSLDSGPSFALESFDRDSSGFSAQFGISAALSKAINLQLSYNYRELGGDINAVNLGISADF